MKPQVSSKHQVLCREKLQAAEAKVRGLVQDKNSALQEKGNLERELKQLRGTTGRLTKVSLYPSTAYLGWVGGGGRVTC